jgi:protein-S-isoprenylcysteine O-methyltransferase Ste14
VKLSRVRVRVGWLLAVLLLALAKPTAFSLAVGLPLAVLGEAIRLWASGHIEKTRALATGGPYAHTRNPLYVGSTLLALGFAAASNSPAVVVATAAYFLVFYPAVIREETAFLARTFGEDFAAWAREVPAFLPRLTPGGPRTTRFDWQRVRMNREWRTAAALPLLVLLLFARGAFLP